MLWSPPFMNSEKLQRHTRFLYAEGSIYLRFNGNLLFHGCIPSAPDGSFLSFPFEGKELSGKEFLDFADSLARQGYSAEEHSPSGRPGRIFSGSYGAGRNSPIFGRDHIATFERMLIDDPSTWAEEKNPYYLLYNDQAYCERILREFSIDFPESRIINGHVPVKVKEGEGPVKAGGKLIVIDGGFCRAYQKYTGIAGYTMFSALMASVSRPISPLRAWKALFGTIRISSPPQSYPKISGERVYVSDTDIGRSIKDKIADLKSSWRLIVWAF